MTALGSSNDVSGHSSPRLVNVTFDANNATLSGGAMYSDQRGVARPQGATCDIGAVEYTEVIFASGFEAATP